jgi:hypothetical protein
MTTVDIRRRLEAELAQSEAPPIGSLVGDALLTGRRLRLRRRFVMGIGVSAGLAIMVAGAVAVSSALGADPALQAGPQSTAPAASGSPTQVVVPGASLMTEEDVLTALAAVLPPGAQVQQPHVTGDEFSTTVVFTLANGNASGQVALGVLAGSDPARLVCHDETGPSCQAGTVNGATVRSFYLPDGVLRVDAGLSDAVIVFIEAEADLLTRDQAVTIATDEVWLS